MTKTDSSSLDRWQGIAERISEDVINAALDSTALYALAWRHGIKSLPWSLSVRLLGAPAMVRLNKKWRGKNYATDVLSFPAPGVFRDQGLLGELVICLPTLLQQAKTLGHPPREELKVLLVHGVLHLLGLDHEKNRYQLGRQARFEQELLLAIGSKAKAGLIDRMSRRTGSGRRALR
jgi:probable rRNA maturation factor